MTKYVDRAGLQVAASIADLVENQILPDLDISPDHLWGGFAAMLADLAPENLRLLEVRETLQKQIDEWHAARKGQPIDRAEYRAFLEDIGYLVPEGDAFKIATENVDPEIATIAGPQLVVPVMNARFALNAANARWGSLYDALYGTDALPGAPEGKGYDPKRGAQAVAWSADFLDSSVPLDGASHADVTAYVRDGAALTAKVGDATHSFQNADAFVGYTEEGDKASYMLRHNGLHIELVIDPSHPVGKDNASGLRDVVLESAMTAIQDCEDSVAAVDAADKTEVSTQSVGHRPARHVERLRQLGGGPFLFDMRQMVQNREMRDLHALGHHLGQAVANQLVGGQDFTEKRNGQGIRRIGHWASVNSRSWVSDGTRRRASSMAGRSRSTQ